MAGDTDGRSPLKQALVAVRQLKARVAELEAQGTRAGDAIAVVGIGCRFPGEVADPEAFWKLVLDGVDATSTVPADRWDPARWPDLPTRGGFLDHVDRFDASFFGIAPREAVEMDPAQRLLLEVAWHALEDAQLNPMRLKGSRTGVWLGLGLSDYGRRHFFGEDPTRLTAWSGTGSFLSVASGRIAYTLGLRGPALTVDTACSSSLVSTHLAIQALRRREVDVALTAGANLLLSPMPSAYFQALQALSPDGRCKTFSSDADGYGRGEGVGVLVLKRLEDALADNDPIRAVLRGSAVNQDGRSNGLTAPSGRAQQQVIREALTDAGLTASDVRVIEAHGTGTPLGDPIEVEALRTVFGDQSLWLGSVKTNFGHTETAAGIAGLIKSILSLEHQTLAPHLHLGQPNPRLRLTNSAFCIPQAPLPWPEAPLRIGVSSFGLSGTNAHVIVEAAPPRAAQEPVEGPAVLALSARTEEALSTLVQRTIDGWSPAAWRALEATAARREALPIRLAAVGDSPEALLDELKRAQSRKATGGGTVWMFTGQGSQWPGMGRALYQAEPLFADIVDRVAAVVPGLLDLWLVADERIHDTRYTQPAIYALQCGLATLLGRHGAAPDAVIGHSIGEYAAAWLAGVFSLEDGARLVEARGRLMAEQPTGGAMTAVFATLSRLGEVPEGAELAARNHPNQSVFSGPLAAIEALEAQCARQEIEVRRLQVSHAFHSAAMDPVLPAFRAAFEGIELRRPSLPWISTLDGEPIGDRATTPAYWLEQLRQPVAFLEATSALADHRLFFELGPHPALCPAVGRTLPDARLVPTLKRDGNAELELWQAVATLWTHGSDVQLRGDRTDRHRAVLSGMPFAPERHWLEPAEPLRTTRLESLRWTETPSTTTGTPLGHWWVIATERRYADVLEGAGCRVTWVEPGTALAPLDPPDAVLVAEDTGTPLRLGAEVTAALAALQAVTAPVSAIVRSERPSGLPGLLRVVRNELPGRAGALIWDPDDLARILPELAASTPEVRLAGPRAIPERFALPSIPAPHGGRIAWITGASGSLGRLLARRLAPDFDRLVLLSRGGVPEAELVRLGSHVRSVRGDVTDNLVPLAAEEPPDVVYHLAGVLEDGPIPQITPAALERVCHPKIDGAWRLHEVAPEADLILVGSAAAQLGNPGQAAYAIANSWLEGFAAWRRAQGVATWCVSLGPVTGTRMVKGHEERLRAQGHLLLEPSEAIEHLVLARAHEQTLLLAAPRARHALRPVPTGLSVPDAVDRALLAVLGTVPPPDRGFFDAGMDSLMAQDLRVRLSSLLQRDLPPTLAFDAPTRDALIAWLGGAPTTPDTLQAAGDDVAIVGMAVRFPGAPDLDAFWSLLDAGIDAVRPIDRWSLEQHASASPTPGRHVIREAGLLDDVAGFDAAHFGIAPREASRLDPQQRLVLEASLGALEHAGLPSEDRVGVFVGIAASEYGRRFDPFDTREPDPYAGTGNESSFAAGRVSHALNLRGPAMAINTACSSSLVAIHLAVRALRAGECKLALAGGVHVLAGPDSTVQLSQLGALSPTGRCHTFSADADGYVRGEGVGMVLLKPLAQAIEDGDTVWAVVKGTAVNHDGRSSGVTVPNGTAQRAVLRAALADAGVEPAAVDAVEAHGTGTRLGDPIEVAAVREVYLPGRSSALALGSVKTNIGHLEAGAGVAGLVKTVLALHHQRLPAHLHLGTPNPDLELDGLEIPTRTRPWSGTLAGVSSFGISGTNAHVVLARGPVRAPPTETPPQRALQVLSTPQAPTAPLLPYPTLRPAQLRALAERPPQRWRAWSLGSQVSEAREPVHGELAWLFTGQGSQFPGMERPLLVEPAFARAWSAGIELLRSWDFPVEVFGDERIHLTQHAQPALFLHGWSLAAWLQSRGIEPDRVMGHSLGELTAAAVAGIWSFEDALRLVVARGRIMGELPAGGATAAVLADEATVRAAIGDDPVDLAGLNGPTETVISGEAAAVEAVLARLTAPSRPLKVSHPFHSRHMEPAVARFEAEVARIRAARPHLPLHTNADGLPLGDRALDPAHWAGLIRQPVRFHLGVEQLHRSGVRTFLELGSRPILTGMVERSLAGVRAIATQPRDGDALDALYGAIGELWVAGVVPDWAAVTGASEGIPAPPSPRRRVRHWVDANTDLALPERWFHRVVVQAGEVHHTADGMLYAGDLPGALASAQQAVAEGERWAPADDDPALQAFARCFALEHPDHWGGPRDDLRRLQPTSPLEPVPLRADGHYLVTGGTGSLGRAIVRELVGQQRTVHVISRHGEPVEGAVSHVVDLADPHALEAWLAAHPVQGIVHGAGIGRRVPLVDETEAGLAEVVAPKAAVSALDVAGLDFFVAISSIAAVWGSAGQAAYAAANGLLERTVAQRRAAGRPARLVALGPVRGGLLDAEGEAWLQRRGLRAISPAEAARAVLRADGVVADVAWPTFLPVQTARLAQPLFDAYQPVSAAPLPTASLHRVHLEAARILGLTPAELPVDRGLFDAGMDSVTAVELARALSTEGRELPATLVFEHGSVAAIHAFLAGQTPVATAISTAPATRDAIVIVGMACRFPGGVDSPASYWELLTAGTDAVGRVPAARWDADAVYDPVPGTPGRSYVRNGAFLDQVDRFDPLFFQIAPREAAALDPQQRLLLEVGWEALERAGLTGTTPGARVGIYVGLPESSYLERFRAPGQARYPDAYAGTGNESSFAAGRLAHALGTQGPALALNTACSSSLVAVHLAAEALQAGDCDAAIAGGVSLMLSPDNHIYLSQLQALAPDGRCKTFGADADGYGRGEGAGVVVLMRDADARAQGRPILARLLGSAVNHDGASSGLTVPNGAAQERVIRDAVARAGITPDTVTYVEAHGTGTRLGDPIEVRALKRALGDTPRTLGSVKTQIGHLEQAAGVASLIKVVLQLQHRTLAPHLHAATLNPELDLGSMQIAGAGGPWEGTVAGVSGFGLSGTNAHLIIGAGEPRVGPARSEGPLCLSGSTPWAVDALRTSLRPAVDALGSGAVAANLWRRRALPVRAFADGVPRHTPAAPRLVFLFTGQGAQRPGMDAALYRDEPVYREAFDEVAALFDLPLRSIFDDERVHDTRFTQPALFALEWALATWWRSIGVEADLVLGHSIGELTAAAWAGMLRLPDAVKLVSARASAMAALEPGGAMAALFADEATVRAALVPGAELAGINTPDETVISGEIDAVEAVIAALGVEHRRLVVSHAFHSARMDGALQAVTDVAKRLAWFGPRIPVVRNLDGALHDDAPSPSYWAQQLRQPVRFLDGVRTLVAEGATTWLEVGPHPVLATAVQRIQPRAVAVGSLRKGEATLMQAAGALWTDGIAVPMERWLPDAPALDLPTTPFDRSRCWLDLPEFVELASPVEQAVLRLAWEPVTGSEPWSGETLEIEPGPLEAIWAQLAQAAAWAEARRPVRFVTRGAALDGEGDPQLCAVHGFVRSARRELDLDWRSVDLAPGAAIPALPDEPWLLVRDDVRAARLVRASLEPVRTGPERILITGGTGGLGLELARALAGRGPVWLLSRSADQADLEGLEGVKALAADVRDAEALRQVLADVNPTRVLHAAGVLADGPLVQPWSAIASVLEVKVQGALALREVLGDDVAYVFFSSASAILGSPGQTAYGAANAVLDGLAASWRAQGLQATSIAWGPWDQVGMAAALPPQLQAQQAQLGIRTLPPRQGVEALLGLQDAAPSLVLPMDWPRFLARHGEPLHTHLGWQPAPVVVQTAGWEPHQGLERLTPWLLDAVREVLAFPADRELPTDAPLQDFGLDSLMAVTLRNRLADRGLDVPIARLIGGPSIEEILVIAQAQLAPLAAPDEPETDELSWFHPLVTHGLLALLALIVGLVLGASFLGIQNPVSAPVLPAERAPRFDR